MFARRCVLFLAVFTLDTVRAAATNKSLAELPIKYPGPVKQVNSELTNRFQVPEQCEGKTYCTVKPDNYPQETFNKMFKGKNVVPQAQLIPEIDFGIRQGDPDEQDDCKTQIDFEPIYKVQDAKQTWRTVVQAPEENYIQRVRLEKCLDTKSSCFTVFPNAPDIQTYCKQEFTTWELVVAHETNKDATEKIRVELPTCCSCIYKFVNVASRGSFKPKA